MRARTERLVGVATALFGLVLLRPVNRRLPDQDVRKHLLKWVPAVVLLGYVKVVERRDLDSVGVEWNGLRPFVRRVVAGVLVMIAASALSQPLFERLAASEASIDADAMEHELAQFAEYSLVERAFIALTAGVVEEFLFRGYATERLAELTGRRGLAALLSTGVFVLAHRGEQWTWSSVARIAVPGSITAGLYEYTRDLLAVAAIHAGNDLLGLLLADRFAAHSDRD